MTTQKKFAVRDLGTALAAVLTDDQIGQILAVTIGAEAEPKLSDYQVELLFALHDRLYELKPEAMDKIFATR